jgi:NAD(P)-dependent dehydrogenase (short-subunit alcohol dehydrogenase family)
MRGKVCVVTGATSGIGLETAKELGAMGARLVLVARDKARGEATLKDLAARGVAAQAYYADLSLLSGMKRVAGEIAAAEPRIDVLINNAGALFNSREATADGLEHTFALNHLGYFVLAHMLKDRLVAAKPSRIVNVASEAHRGMMLDFSDLQFEKNYLGFRAYGRSKLCNILFTRELARKLAGIGVAANCLHPGFVATHFGDNNPGFFRAGIGIAKRIAARTVEKGAETVVYLASSPEAAATTGEYFFDCKPKAPSAAAQNDDDARRLWQESVRLSGVG